MSRNVCTHLSVGGLFISLVLGGCADTSKVNEKDPWESWNHRAQGFNDDLDKAIVKPVAKVYSSLIPGFVNAVLANFFGNLNDIGVTVNDLLQFKMAQGGMDASRFLINSTAGVVGFVDVAKMMDFPKHNEDFGQTLGFWGIPSGNYLVLPFFGASSPREVVGVLGDALLNPLTYTFVFAGSGAVFGVINVGAKAVDVNDSDLIYPEMIIDENFNGHYDFIKNTYQQSREQLLHDGNVPDKEPFQLADQTLEPSQQIKQKSAISPYQHMFISP